MKTVNNKKFVTLTELADYLNSKLEAKNLHYGVPELACAWANTRAQYYQEFGEKVKNREHYINGQTEAEQLLSLEGCKLIEKYATVDAHNVPIITDGIAEIFK